MCLSTGTTNYIDTRLEKSGDAKTGNARFIACNSFSCSVLDTHFLSEQGIYVIDCSNRTPFFPIHAKENNHD